MEILYDGLCGCVYKDTRTGKLVAKRVLDGKPETRMFVDQDSAEIWVDAADEIVDTKVRKIVKEN